MSTWLENNKIKCIHCYVMHLRSMWLRVHRSGTCKTLVIWNLVNQKLLLASRTTSNVCRVGARLMFSTEIYFKICWLQYKITNFNNQFLDNYFYSFLFMICLNLQPGGSPYHTIHQVDTSLQSWNFSALKQNRSNSWSESLDDCRLSNNIVEHFAINTETDRSME